MPTWKDLGYLRIALAARASQFCWHIFLPLDVRGRGAVRDVSAVLPGGTWGSDGARGVGSVCS